MRTRFLRVFVFLILLALISAYALRAFRKSPRRTVSTRAHSPAPSIASPSPSSPSNPSAPAAVTTVQPGIPPSDLSTSGRAPPTATPSRPITPPSAPDAAAMLAIDQVSLMIRDYRTVAGENPVGTNAEIMAAVMGDNPKHARLGPPEGAQLNDKGELIDRWDTPYFFHQLSRDHMEIRSAGPDKVMGTADDAVIK